jgi:hypothetical protein
MFLLEQVRQAKDCREMNLAELCDGLSEIDSQVGSDLAEQLVQTLRRINSPDELFDTLIALEGLLLHVVNEQAPWLDSSAVLGLFIRKVLIKFHTGLFEGLSSLFDQFLSYLSFFEESESEPNEEVLIQAELANFVPHHAGIIETAPTSLQESHKNRICNTAAADACSQPADGQAH